MDDGNVWLDQQKNRLDELLRAAREPGRDPQQMFHELLDLSNQLLDLSKRSLELGRLASAAAQDVLATRTESEPPGNGRSGGQAGSPD